jgi:hypothetical protein
MSGVALIDHTIILDADRGLKTIYVVKGMSGVALIDHTIILDADRGLQTIYVVKGILTGVALVDQTIMPPTTQRTPEPLLLIH